MKKFFLIIIFLLIGSKAYGDITIDKFLKIIADPRYENKITAVFILTDGEQKKICRLSGLENDSYSIKSKILIRAEELFAEGKIYSDLNISIDCPKKDFLENIPNLQEMENQINEIISLNDAKPIMLKMVKAVYALKEMFDY